MFADTRTIRTSRQSPLCRLSLTTHERLTELKGRTGASFDAIIHKLVTEELLRVSEVTR